MPPRVETLRDRLDHHPRELLFGTSGRRGLVADLTQLEIYVNVLAELRYLQSLDASEGGICPGEKLYLAHDLRPSSTVFDPAHQGHGEIFQAAALAAEHAGMRPVNLGAIPTPALMYYAVRAGRGSIMVTGSHIPFDRNGYKLNTSRGELLKQHEEPIGRMVRQVREEVYATPAAESIFDSRGMLREGHRALPAVDDRARAAYLARYTDFFTGESLAGKRIVAYQHSAVGRDLLVELLRAFGAEVIPAGRSDRFVPIDTENIDAAQLAAIQALVTDRAIDAVVSTDGDSDRPLILGAEDGAVRFFGGDLVGMIVAEFLGADSVVVPVSCNDGIDRGPLAGVLEPKTRIGSPYVIAGMQAAGARGRRRICGWEANGGFLLGSGIEREGRVLSALPTRDAMLPILCVLFAAARCGVSLAQLFARLPRRYSRAALLKDFPRAVSRGIIERFVAGGERLQEFFPPETGLGRIAGVDLTDGLRITFANGEVAHFRPSGNADEFRCYAVADTQARADAIAAMAVAEPGGILRRMERAG